MFRWHEEEGLSRRRLVVEQVIHTDRATGEVWACPCIGNPGYMRKHRPYESCGGHCSVCEAERYWARQARRRERRGSRTQIAEQMLDLTN